MVLDEREVERRDDLLSRFLDAEVDGATLSREDILDISFLFLIAGLDTVTSTLDCMFSYLAQHPEQRRQLVDDPSLIPAAMEELLRWETPVMGVPRVALADTELAGCPIHAGDQVMMLLGVGQHRRGRVRRRRHRPLGPRGQPPPGLRRWHPPVPGLAPGPPGAAHRAAGVAPSHPRLRRWPRATRWCTPPASAPSSDFPMVFPPRGRRVTLDPGAARLDGRVAVVTGGGAGIGRGIAGGLAAFGARVAIWERDPDTAVAAADELDGLGLTVDVRDGAQVAGALAATIAELGQVDILVNNAGGRVPGAAAGDLGERDRRPLPGQPAPRDHLHPAGGAHAWCTTGGRAASSTSPPSRASGPRRASPPTPRPRPASSTSPRPRPSSWPPRASGSTPWPRTSP